MRKAAVSESRIDLPNIDTALFQQPDAQRLMAPERATHAPRFLLLYGSLRERSFSRLAAEEAAHPPCLNPESTYPISTPRCSSNPMPSG